MRHNPKKVPSTKKGRLIDVEKVLVGKLAFVRGANILVLMEVMLAININIILSTSEPSKWSARNDLSSESISR